MDKKFLITYGEDGVYRFFSIDKIEYTLGLSTFDTRVIPAIEQEDYGESFYMREITDTNLKVEVFNLQATDDPGDQTFVLNTTEQVHSWVEDSSFVTSGEEKVNSSWNVAGGRAEIVVGAPVPNNFRVQFSYYGSEPLIEGDSYDLTIDSETKTLICGLGENGILYLGDYEYFMGTETSVAPEPEDIVIGSALTAEITDYIEYSAEKETQYKIIFQKSGEAQQTFYNYVGIVENFVADGYTYATAAYVGNLNIYDNTKEDTGEPFLIVTGNREDGSYKSYLYVREEGTYTLTIDLYDLVVIPELTGAALVSFGQKVGDEVRDNYGIGINSGDSKLTLPSRAISLFETQLVPNPGEQDNKISFNYRGILGTLSEDLLTSLDIASNIKSNMNNTQGIYTDNMYIGDSEQYVAFYRDKNDNNKAKLDVKGSVYIGDSTLNSVVNIENGAISLGNPLGFHIYINGRKDNTNTYGLGFYGETHLPYQRTYDTTVVSGKKYYKLEGLIFNEIENPSGNPQGQGWYEETDRDKRVAYLDEEKLYIPYTVVLKGMDLGDVENSDDPLWRWELQEDTKNLTLKWLGRNE